MRNLIYSIKYDSVNCIMIMKSWDPFIIAAPNTTSIWLFVHSFLPFNLRSNKQEHQYTLCKNQVWNNNDQLRVSGINWIKRKWNKLHEMYHTTLSLIKKKIIRNQICWRIPFRIRRCSVRWEHCNINCYVMNSWCSLLQ